MFNNLYAFLWVRINDFYNLYYASMKGHMNKILNPIRSFFKFNERSTTFKKEILGGISTFLAMAYILAVNPGMLVQANGAAGYAGVFFLGTAISAFVGTLAMGLFANIPVALAPGMGVNAFFTYTVASNIMGMQVEQALIATFFSGILYAIVALTPLRSLLAKLLPKNIKLAIGAMIGLFLAYIGLCDSGIIVSGASPFGNAMAHAGDTYMPTALADGALGVATATKLGNFQDPFVIVALVILALVFILHFAKVKGSALIAILVGVILLAILKAAHVGDADNAFKLQDYNEFSKFGKLSSGMWDSIGSSFKNGKFYIALFVFLYIDFFDTTGTLFTVGEQAGLNKDPEQSDKWLKKANIVDAGSTIFGSIMLTSTTTSYIESSVGVSQGARTGFASVVTGLLFALAIAAWPIMTPILPISHTQEHVHAQIGTVMPITGPVLVLVGSLMVSQLRSFDWKAMIDIPMLFITMIFGVLSYSISTGIAAGILVYASINLSLYAIALIQQKRGKEFVIGDLKIEDFKERALNIPVLVMAALAIVYFGTMPLYYG